MMLPADLPKFFEGLGFLHLRLCCNYSNGEPRIKMIEKPRAFWQTKQLLSVTVFPIIIPRHIDSFEMRVSEQNLEPVIQ